MSGGYRGIFFDEETVRTVEQILTSEGYQVTVDREPFAGEDDDEDQPWSVVTDAPVLVLEVLVDRFDGWLDDDGVVPEPPAPLVLPEAPKRHHQPPV